MKHAPITPDPMLAIAASIIETGQVPAYELSAYFTYEEWRSAADFVQDTNDTSELAWMVRQQRLFDLWCGCSEAEQARWNDDFLAWAEDVGEPWLANIERVERKAA